MTSSLTKSYLNTKSIEKQKPNDKIALPSSVTSLSRPGSSKTDQVRPKILTTNIKKNMKFTKFEKVPERKPVNLEEESSYFSQSNSA